MAIDPILVEVIANRLDEIQQVMKQRLFRTGYSTILRESFDGSSGLVLPDSRLIGSSGIVTHTTPYVQLVQAITGKYGFERIFPGDTFITNDPYRGGASHTPDVSIATPAFVDGELVAFCTSIVHMPDIGGIAPSSSSASSRSIFHEGLLLPPVKLYEREILNEGVRSIIENNTRTPVLLIGDIEGQVGCTRIGVELLTDLCRRHGASVVRDAIEVILRSSETRLRQGLAALPDGETEAENFLDRDGVVERPVRVHVRVIKRGDSITVDFSGSDPQTAGPANAVGQVIRAAAAGAVVSFVDHTIPYNDGVLKTVQVVLPQRLVVNPVSPAPVNSYVPATHPAFNNVTRALGELVPERAVAESGVGLGATAFSFGANRAGATSVLYEIFETSLGGTALADGASLDFPISILESIQPIEIIESEFPIRVRRFDIPCDSAGAGKHRGGLGYVREYEVLEPCHFMSRMGQRAFGSHGMAGGGSPKLSTSIYNPGRPRERVLRGLDQELMEAGDVIRIEQAGGAGMGNPAERAADKILNDVADGFVSIQHAERHYGYIIGRDATGRYVITGRTRRGD